ncbi:RDD family protein [Rasiella rasia]|uniref:RDD family protein n=1 Tax=Rasiella rasia TaxID=2744027 RepID=A0A6G6GQ82_9FLAO|nr:RDD family protein [Rasiella rasia]QIE60709.1 RDD family protein [Rasiella rasia]
MDKTANAQSRKVDKGVRLTNYLVDTFVILLAWLLISAFLGGIYQNSSLFYVIMFLYYFVLEVVFQKTLGKIVTKTVVTDKYGNKPNVIKVLIRSFLRLIPVDSFSYLFGTEVGFHDAGSSTRLSKDPQ